MAQEGRGRPPPFSPGTLLSKHFRVQALVRLSESRMYYLVDDDRPDSTTRRCWSCGDEESLRNAESCVCCGMPFADRRQFLMSTRWDQRGFDAYVAFHEKGLVHPAILAPEEIFFHEGTLCTVIPYNNEALMLDESSPFEDERILYLAQRFAGLLAFLHHHGVSLSAVSRPNLICRPEEDRVFLFDPDVSEVFDGEVPDHARGTELRDFATMLHRFVPVNQNGLQAFFTRAAEGEYSNSMDFGRAIERLFDDLEDRAVPVGLAAITDVGLLRVLNEDTWRWTELTDDTHLYVVADGMGGHDSGEVASAVAVETICRVAREEVEPNQNPDALEGLLDFSFQSANNTIKSMAEERQSDMGTTLVAALISGTQGLLANVGDSRGYLMRDDVLYLVTRDHSLVARMVEQNRLSPEEARIHPHSNILLRTVGTERDVEIDIFRVDLEPGDRILLCSDGLWGEVPDAMIEGLLKNFPDPRICARELLRAAHRGGGKDNVTILLIGI